MENKKPFMEFFKEGFVIEKTDIKDKFNSLLYGLTVNLNEKEDCDFDHEIFDIFIDENDKDLPILKEKMNNLIKLINSMEPNERKIFSNQELKDV